MELKKKLATRPREKTGPAKGLMITKKSIRPGHTLLKLQVVGDKKKEIKKVLSCKYKIRLRWHLNKEKTYILQAT